MKKLSLVLLILVLFFAVPAIAQAQHYGGRYYSSYGGSYYPSYSSYGGSYYPSYSSYYYPSYGSSYYPSNYYPSYYYSGYNPYYSSYPSQAKVVIQTDGGGSSPCAKSDTTDALIKELLLRQLLNGTPGGAPLQPPAQIQQGQQPLTADEIARFREVLRRLEQPPPAK